MKIFNTVPMCGIWFYLTRPDLIKSSGLNKQELYNKYMTVQPRGPDNSELKYLPDYGLMIGFHRLKIMDQSTKGDQPFILEDELKVIYVICNGEIYNYKALTKQYELVLNSGSDCEVIGHLYLKLGIDTLVKELNGEFAFCIFECNKVTKEVKVIMSRDVCGVRPLYITTTSTSLMGASILNGLLYDASNPTQTSPRQFPPRQYAVLSNVDFQLHFTTYFKFENIPCVYNLSNSTLAEIHTLIRNTLKECVRDRVMSDRKIGALVSGGVDSSLNASLLAEVCHEAGITLYTFSISTHKNSPDEIAARKVATHIKSIHTHILKPPHEGLQARKKVIRVIGSYDVTSVRASTWQLLLMEWISQNTDIKVLIIGDGADEVASGYKYNFNAPNPSALHDEAIFRTNDIHHFDGKRADRCISVCGLEARLPFLDKRFVSLYLSIDPALRMPSHPGLFNEIEPQEKRLLRQAFDVTDYLPKEILYRPKEAFSDGVSLMGESWFEIIQKDIAKQKDLQHYLDDLSTYDNHIVPTSIEEACYRMIFRSIFGQFAESVVPYKWLPKWCGNVTDPSARVLSVYTQS